MKPPRSNRLGMYADVREVADLALRHGGGSYDCADHGQAIHFQQRFYRFRKLYAQLNHEDGTDSPYDKLKLPRIPEDGCSVKLEIRQHVGTFRPSGPEVFSSLTGEDDLFKAASELARKIQGD